MKFIYRYRTSDNVQHQDVISAASREAAFVALKSRGIKPSYVGAAPGLANWIVGVGRQWLLVVALSVAVVALLLMVARRDGNSSENAGVLDRRQLLGDASIIARGVATDWAEVFPRNSDRFLSRFVQPGSHVEEVSKAALTAIVDELRETMTDSVPADDIDLDEVRQVKRIVAGMREEMATYIADGGAVDEYVSKLFARQQYEAGLLRRAQAQLSEYRRRHTHDEYNEEWKRVNRELRTFGLPLIPLDLE